MDNQTAALFFFFFFFFFFFLKKKVKVDPNDRPLDCTAWFASTSLSNSDLVKSPFSVLFLCTSYYSINALYYGGLVAITSQPS